MPTVKKPKTTSPPFSTAEIVAAKAAAPARSVRTPRVDWSEGVVTHGGGVVPTVEALRRTRGANKKPAQELVAIRLDREIVGAFRASGPGWQTRISAALKEWLASQPVKRKARSQRD